MSTTTMNTAHRSDDYSVQSPAPATLPRLLARLRDCSGFPTLSATIGDINRVVADDEHSARQLTQVILRDVSLTTKLLQVVNSAIYGQYRGSIRTVSKAVLILGAEAVRNAAMTLMMLEFTNGRPQDKSLHDELIGAFFAGVVAKALCRRLGMPNSEEAVICTMFQGLGRLLVTFFLYEESRQVRALIETGVPEEQAAGQVLGMSYSDLGVGVARHWNLPDRLIEAMQRIEARDIARPTTDVQKLKLAANLANDLYTTALRSSPAERHAQLQALSQRYSAAIKMDVKDLMAAIDQGLAEFADRSAALSLPAAQSPTLKAIRIWSGDSADGSAQSQAANVARADDTIMERIDALDALETQGAAELNAQQVLSAGIRDVAETLTSEFALNDVLHMVLETMYRGMGFTRTMIFVRDVRLNSMRARFGFGAGIERIIPQCSFPLVFAPDVFHVALQKGADINIENTAAGNIVQRIPQWHRRAVNAKSFLLLPIVFKNQALALLYADCERPEGIKIDAEQLGLLRTLRSQVALAFKHGGASGRG